MQRDAYAALFKKVGKVMVPLNILQVSGEVTHERIFEEVFDGYRVRRIVLMTHMKGSGPHVSLKTQQVAHQEADYYASKAERRAARNSNGALLRPRRVSIRGSLLSGRPIDLPQESTNACDLPLLEKDVVVDNFAKLLQIHQPHFMYRLVPLFCTDMSTLACLQAICSLPNSPFNIDGRRDPVILRTGWHNSRSPLREEVWRYFEPKMTPGELAIPRDTRKFPCGNGIDFDGILTAKRESSKAPSHVAMLQMRSNITIPAAEEFGHQIDFFTSSTFKERVLSNVPMFHEVLNCKSRSFFLAAPKEVERSMKERLLRVANQRGFFVLEQKGPTAPFSLVS